MFSAGSAGNYDITYDIGTLTVTAAALTITANNVPGKTYGTALTPAGTEFSSIGLVNGDTISSVGLESAGYAPAATVAYPGPIYPITPSAAVFSAGSAGNYNIAYFTGNLTVNAAALTITAASETKSYGATFAPSGTTQFTTSGLVNSDTVTSVSLTSGGYAATATVEDSPYTITPSAAVGSGLGNYNISFVNQLFYVEPAATTTTLSSSVNPSIDGEDVTFTATVGNTQTTASPAGSVEFVLNGTNQARPVSISGGSATTTIALATGNYTVQAVYSDPDDNFSTSTGTGGQVVNAVTAANLQNVLATTSTPTLEALGNNTNLQTIISAINGLAPTTATITVNLGSGTFSDSTLSPPAGVTVVVIGNGTTTTFVGNSPAFQVTQGSVSVSGVTFTTATDAPTILVSGGSLTLLNDTIQESTGGTDAAVSISGTGSVNLGTAASPGNNILNVNGLDVYGHVLGEFVHNTTGDNSVPASGDTYEVNGVPITAPYLSFTSLASSSTTSVYGQSVTLTATIVANTPSTGTPGGSVDFFDTTTNTDLGSHSVSGGSAVLMTSALGAGTHRIRAFYSGDSNFTLSLDALTQTVTPASLTITANNEGKTYGTVETLSGTAFTQTGLVNSDTIAGVTETSVGRPCRRRWVPISSCPAPPSVRAWAITTSAMSTAT